MGAQAVRYRREPDPRQHAACKPLTAKTPLLRLKAVGNQISYPFIPCLSFENGPIAASRRNGTARSNC